MKNQFLQNILDKLIFIKISNQYMVSQNVLLQYNSFISFSLFSMSSWKNIVTHFISKSCPPELLIHLLHCPFYLLYSPKAHCKMDFFSIFLIVQVFNPPEHNILFVFSASENSNSRRPLAIVALNPSCSLLS